MNQKWTVTVTTMVYLFTLKMMVSANPIIHQHQRKVRFAVCSIYNMEYDNVDPYNQHLHPPSVTEDLICGSNNAATTEQGIIIIIIQLNCVN